MTLSGLYIIPHGDEIIDCPNEESRIMADSIKQMVREDRSETVAIISPHGLALREKVSVIGTERLRGYFKLQTRILKRTYIVDRELLEAVSRDLSEWVEPVKYITSSGPLSVFPIDFGTLIPLTFLTGRKILAMGQPRPKNTKALYNFGRELFRFIRTVPTPVSVVISADQAHTHSREGPYGYSNKAKPYDKLVSNSVDSGAFDDLLNLTPNYIEDAKPDSFWNMAILAGFLKESRISMKVRYYYVQKYFGMLSASPS